MAKKKIVAKAKRPAPPSAGSRAKMSTRGAPASSAAKKRTGFSPSAGSKDAGKRIKSITNAPNTVDKTEAIRERLRLYPLAMPNEIAAMLEFDGLKVSAAEVEQVRGSSQPKEVTTRRSPRDSGPPPVKQKKK